jgi:hypothetical protein
MFVVGLEPQEVCGTLIGKDGLLEMAGAEFVEWYQIPFLVRLHPLRSRHYYKPSSTGKPAHPVGPRFRIPGSGPVARSMGCTQSEYGTARA